VAKPKAYPKAYPVANPEVSPMASPMTKGRHTEPSGLWHQPTIMNMIADMLIVVAVAALAWAALTLVQRLPVFPLRELLLDTPPGRVTPLEIEHIARSAITGNFFTIDLDATRAEVEKLPWVRNAVVRRQWPHGITLSIEEHEVLAHWQPLGSDDKMALVNTLGEVFLADLPESAGALPRFSGPEGSAPEVLRRHAELDQALAAIDRRVGSVTLSARRAWRVSLDDGTVIEFGRDQDRYPLSERIARFVAHYEETRQRVGAFRNADMRYPNGFAVSGFQIAAEQDSQS